MPSTQFDAHGLGAVAYAQVKPDGTSPSLNSGVSTTRIATGTYQVVLPEEQDPSRTVIMIQPFSGQGVTGCHSADYLFGPPDTADNRTIQIQTWLVSSVVGTLRDHAFNILVLRSGVTPAPGSSS